MKQLLNTLFVMTEDAYLDNARILAHFRIPALT